jgi:hypothetical protein
MNVHLHFSVKRNFSQLLRLSAMAFVMLLYPGINYAQVINEGFEESDWPPTLTTSVFSTSNFSTSSQIITISATGTASINNGEWRLLQGTLAGSGSGSNSTIVPSGNKSLWFGTTSNGLIITPIITSGISSVSFKAYPYGSSAVGLYVAVNTNTSHVTSATGNMTVSSAGAASWSGSTY